MIGVELLTENLCKLVCHLSTLMACHFTTDKHCKPTEMRSSLQGQIMSAACPGKPSKKCWPTLQQWVSLYLLQWVPRLLQQLPKPLQIAPTQKKVWAPSWDWGQAGGGTSLCNSLEYAKPLNSNLRWKPCRVANLHCDFRWWRIIDLWIAEGILKEIDSVMSYCEIPLLTFSSGMLLRPSGV